MSGIVLRADSHQLVFLLPALILLPPGRHSPCLHGCTLEIKPGGAVEIQAPSREFAFEQAARFLKPHLKDRPAFEISATLRTPCRDRFERLFHRNDRWSILCNASVAFAPTAMPSVLAAG